MTLQGRTALVTGGSKGIGRAIAFALARDGADVGISFANDESVAEACIETIRAEGRRGIAIRAPAEDPDALEHLVDGVQKELGSIDILVNNTGYDWDGTPVADTRPEDLLRVMRVNALAAHQLCSLVLPRMRECSRGDIVMISSTVTEVLGAGYAPYAMSKAALEALAFVLAKEERDHGIHVNIVAPGLVEAGMGLDYIERTIERTGVGGISDVAAAAPYGRVCQPDEVASVVHFLVSEGSSYVNAQRIYVQGGGT